MMVQKVAYTCAPENIHMFGNTNIVPARFRGNDVDAETAALIDYAVKDLTRFF